MATNKFIEHTSSGLYCRRGDFYVDPWRPVDRAVLTHGHSDHARSGSALYYTVDKGLPILQKRLGLEAKFSLHKYREPFRLGDVKVSFHPAGHILGSSQVRMECDGEVWVISGDYKRGADATCESFEVVPCDVFITEATFGLPVYRWKPTEEIAKDIFDWWERNRLDGKASLLACYSLGKAQRVLAELIKFTDRAVYTHGATEAINECYRQLNVPLLPTIKVSENDKGLKGELILAPPSALGSPWARKFGDAEIGFASGWMRIRGNRRRRGYDRGFALSDHADWPELLDTIKATGARRVLVTHGNQDVLSAYLREIGIEAIPLSTFFEGEAET